VVTPTSLDKDSSDIGSLWSDGTHQFRIAEISAGAITFWSVPFTYSGSWQMTSTIGSTITHVSGAVHTSTITASTKTTAQKFPVVTGVTITLLANGITAIGSNETGRAVHVDVVEEFDLIDPSTNNTAANPWEWDSGDVWMHAKNTYQIYAGGTSVHCEWTVMRPMLIRDFGFTQSATLIMTGYDQQWSYIPKTKPLTGGYDFKNIQDLLAYNGNIFLTDTEIDSPADPPDRNIILLKRSSDSTYDLGMSFGYGPTYGARQTQYYWSLPSYRKSYPYFVGGLGLVAPGTKYDCWYYRQWIDPTSTGAGKLVTVRPPIDSRQFVDIDYHKSVVADSVQLPTRFAGKSITVIQSETLSISETRVPPSCRITASTTGGATYGRATIELH